MKDTAFIESCFKQYMILINNHDVIENLIGMKRLLNNISQNNKKVIFIGNGASAAIAGHAALDYTKQAKIKSVCFNEAALLTAYSNDYGYENWVTEALRSYGEAGDCAVFISSSGQSRNIVNGARFAKDHGIHVISFSGFEKNNPLDELGEISFWVESQAYNLIENIHQIWLMIVCDLIIGKMEYSVS